MYDNSKVTHVYTLKLTHKYITNVKCENKSDSQTKPSVSSK